jgi:3-dehydroquinate dehydratase-2
MKVLILNGPNLNMLGKREEIYGCMTLEEINEMLRAKARELGIEIAFYQSNHEGDLIERIQNAQGEYDGIIINPGGLTHYSVSLRDALSSFKGKKVEVHITNIFSRESFRRVTVTGEAVDVVIVGAGEKSYLLALYFLGDA